MLSLLLLSGCFKQQYSAKPFNTQRLLNEINSWSADVPKLIRFLRQNGIPGHVLSHARYSMKRLYLTGLYYDPKRRVAYQQWEKAKIVSEHTQYNINPELSIPLEHHGDTATGESTWTLVPC